MALAVDCPNCNRKLRFPDSAAGRRGKCPSCGTSVDIPPQPQSFALPPINLDEDDAPYGYSPLPSITDAITPDPHLSNSGEAQAVARQPNNAPAIQQVVAHSQFYVYKMVQIPPNIQIDEGTSTKGRAAAYLEGVVNVSAAQGWEFFRVDEIGIQINPGCLGGLFGAKAQRVGYYVVTFRRPTG